ncbi:MAG: HigA family addiction module antidote protein [Candidatus Marinimicrobia bacterium]|jgi:addiction module HigA family antidote|nr:HigA family addiction module antidote protein [Candidatus Neomarinimicrobiota bacterium]MBT4155371.1 HigA family addiction module antidote protein [Candidatus Neomarinimicrobiota bacterium]MBT4554721.1 HigA family addiction module antidote protein [Candidatus Neomarinimicrobiota bacterium]MBT4752318.1 HigA family addiction module antidote protein [Candidatus Neomarinimicrobiota bacterium]MBT5115155.1 HigA family addiction module antidote protein [Candidatus Neomarinimicrobiota bacterium]|tara:strand:+ start:10159 stop:10449 length:291 start_codon:yes stop_codon:yes gene_type:complete
MSKNIITYNTADGNASVSLFAKDIRVPQTRLSQMIKGKRQITADTALRLSSYFGNSTRFWLGLQDDYDIEEVTKKHKDIFNEIRSVRNNKIEAELA